MRSLRPASLREFLDEEAVGGLVLFAAAVIALVWANSPWSDSYFELWETGLELGLGSATIDLDLQHWVNDLLMAVFFFVVGLEIKRELVTGELRDRGAAALPAVGAVAGVALPAVIFIAIVGTGGEEARGWAIPAATDIAFAVAALALFGRKLSDGARLLLLSIAIVDDIIAILIIAVFYADGIAAVWLAIAAAGIAAVLLMQRLGVWRALAYLPLALVIWIAFHESGIHATIAGVALGLLVPVRPLRGHDVHSRLENGLHPISAFVVIPIFALANAGVDFGGGVLDQALSSKLTWAVAAALVLGKLLGITGASLLAIRARFGRLPTGMPRSQVLAVAAFAGIGFTVSLFIAELAFGPGEAKAAAKTGIFIGSLASGLLGALLARPRALGSQE